MMALPQKQSLLLEFKYKYLWEKQLYSSLYDIWFNLIHFISIIIFLPEQVFQNLWDSALLEPEYPKI
jgi:hypothetical protein